MTHTNTKLSETLPRRRRILFIVVSIICIAIIVAVFEFRSRWIGFQLLRFRTTTSFVFVRSDGKNSAFSLNEKQTRDLLNAIGKRTYATIKRRSVKYRDYVDVSCKDGRSACLRSIWVHPAYEAESNDVIEELIQIAKRGVPADPNSDDGLCEDTSSLEREFD